MKPNDSQTEFQKFAARSGIDLAHSTPLQGISQMLSFFHEMESEGCEENDGDMLLYEWGTYNWGGEHFSLSVVRQFIATDPTGGENDVMSQLRLVYRFEPTPDLKALGHGNRWMHGPNFIAWRDFVFSSPAFVAVADRQDSQVEVVHGLV